jgi:glycosyltransferase involved in cell wall biosynthesis
MRLPRVCVVGPLPPPWGGMGNQCQLLVRLLRSEGIAVELVQTNAPYHPAWVGSVPMLRAACRLLPYLRSLWRACARADVVHVLANSGWAWHLFAAPAIAIARFRRAAVIVNYHGGSADTFFAQGPRYVLKMLAGTSLRVMPSAYLQRVFSQYGLSSEVIPNIVDLSLFTPLTRTTRATQPHIVVTRNLEPIYDIATAIRALALIRQRMPSVRMTIAGCGPDREKLQALAHHLGQDAAIHFAGRLVNGDVARLVASASCLLNPSTVDNMPVSILEAFACGVPVVSTRAGGIPDMLEDGVAGLLVPVGDDTAMAKAVLRILQNPLLALHFSSVGLVEVEKYSWKKVRRQWLDAYCRAAVGVRT